MGGILVVIGTDGIGNCKSNYHTFMITTTTVPVGNKVNIHMLNKIIKNVNEYSQTCRCGHLY